MVIEHRGYRMERLKVSEQLRAILSEELFVALTERHFSERIGVSQASISRFVRGERDLSLSTVDRICAALGYELVPIIRPLRRKRPTDFPEAQDDGEPF